MTDRVKFKAFPTAFKLAAIKRLEAGEAVLPLARKLGVSRKLLVPWPKPNSFYKSLNKFVHFFVRRRAYSHFYSHADVAWFGGMWR